MPKMIACPITGQVGTCPSAAAPQTNDTNAYNTGFHATAEEQQARLWQSLLEHNYHSNSSSSSDDDSCLDSDFSPYSPTNTITKETSSLSPPPPHPQERQRDWPSYDQVTTHVLMSDYQESLTSPLDQYTDGRTKRICPHGAVCQVQLELFDHKDTAHPPYSGLLTPGATVEHGLLRLSSALRPVVDDRMPKLAQAALKQTFGPRMYASQIIPAAALKLFRNSSSSSSQPQPQVHEASGNILLMGSKVGQASTNFFDNCLCTAMTEKIPRLGLPFLRRFSRYSQYPLALGLSDLCRVDQHGMVVDKQTHNFPFALCFQPVVDMSKFMNRDNNQSDSDYRPFDAFIDDCVKHVPPGTVLFDVYCAPTPESVGDASQLQRIGRITTTSRFLYSSPNDGLTFRHQTKEDDLALRPDWHQRMHAPNVVKTSKETGSAAKLTGWHVFQEHIERRVYVDFERPHHAYFHQQEPQSPKQDAITVPGWTFCGLSKSRVSAAT